MVLYLIKSTACMLIFFVCYKLWLEKEKAHMLKRIYLLVTLALALAIPLITFTTYIESPVFENASQAIISSEQPSIQNETRFNWSGLLWKVYWAGVLLFGFRFLYHLFEVVFKIKHNPAIKKRSFTHVLMQKDILPHTFFNYLFFNKEHYESNAIPEEVILHEEAHALQKHSLDILFIELLQVICWFNPIIWLYKSAIKLNHEFLADSAVLNQGIETTTYQQTLLFYATNSCSPAWAHHINHSSIKKRLVIMKTRNSRKVGWLKSLFIIPVTALMLFSFSNRKVIERPVESQEAAIQMQEGATQAQLDEYNALAKKYNAQPRDRRIIKFSEIERLEYLYAQMTPQQKKAAQPFPDCAPPPPPPLPPGASEEAKAERLRIIEEYKRKYPEMAKNIPPDSIDDMPEPVAPPPPPPPVSPVVHLEQMIKKGAIFYINNKKVSSKEAQEFVETNDKLHVRTKEKNGRPKVYLSNKPIQ